ncbi:MAG: glycosyltransferase [Myxococcales bacterium]|nr:glycosyltransferase [Myxococcales bacterium]
MLGSRRAGIPVIQPSDKTLNERSPTGLARTALTVFHASRIRSVQGFFTTGLLGTNALRSIGASAEHIVPGLYPIDVNHWQTQRAAFRSRSLSYRQTLGGKFIVLAVSKWSERENPLQVVDAFAELLLTCPESRLVYVGDGPLRDRVRRRIKARKLEPFVTLPGYVPYDELPLYYGCADVFVHAPECEPWGISVLEAMASSVPVIANTTVGAAADLVIPGITGDLSYAGSSSSLAAALRRMHTWMEHRPLGANALERVRRFDVHKAAENLQDLCWKLTSGKPAHDDFSKILISDLRNAFGRWPT